ncbi:hypothetical protein EDWATA_03092 [Edwardsiella tarda ATCC 23685]|uniref:Uncharacterized protein n=1 Tax=Edwardsiella tarda ATCC 23685 TaxID=500638 RepID=D4F8J9_EDWTA|nr:hypothetical protein EDWATA_03092 [Edwardsiella tarda ATCC 23685]
MMPITGGARRLFIYQLIKSSFFYISSKSRTIKKSFFAKQGKMLDFHSANVAC